MAYKSRIRFTIQDASDNYYVATLQTDGTYTVTTTPTLTYLGVNPLNWENTGVTWERNMTYFGVFRSQSQTMQFTADGRAILLSIMFGSGGVNAFARLKVWLYNESTFAYDLFYSSELDFSTVSDDKKQLLTSISTLDSKLYELLKSKANTKFAIPFWDYDPDTDTWDYVSAGSEFLLHEGIKLFWGAKWQTSASGAVPLTRNGTLYGWNRGSVSDGRHWIPAMTQVNITQNNGTTTFIGNDILQPFLPQYNQAYNYNRNFEGTDDIQAYTLNRGLFKHLLENCPTIDLNFTVTGEFDGDITYNNPITQDQFIAIVLFEIGDDDLPVLSGGNYQYTELYKIIVPSGGSPYTPPSASFTNTTTVTINYNKAYVVGIIYDGVTSGISGAPNVSQVSFNELFVQVETAYNSGTGTPYDGAILNPSVIIGQRLFEAFRNVLDVIDSTETNAYGFPVLNGTGYSILSDILTDNTADPDDSYDSTPYRLLLTSENAIRNVVGYPYMNVSLSDLFNICFKMYACGLGIFSELGVRVEPLDYWFDSATEILNLGNTVANFSVRPYTEIMGNSVNGGYGESDTNKNFSVDAFNISQTYDLPLNKTPKPIDLQVTECNTEMYYIEKARAQNNSNDSSPSSSNDLVLFQITDTTTGTSTIKPNGDVDIITAYTLQTYPTAQSTDPTATSDPYLYGLKYPETAINTGITPASNKLRLGSFIRTLCDGLEGANDYVTYRKQYQQQYNDPSTPATSRPGISKNVGAGLITEVDDVLINTLGSKYFRPYILKIDSKYDVNMYDLINTNPRGYISFTWDGTQYKGFIYRVSYVAGNLFPTTFELLAHPSTTDAQLRA